MKTIQFKMSQPDYEELLIQSRENTGAKAISKAIEERARYKDMYQDMVKQFEEMNEHAKIMEMIIKNKNEADNQLNEFLAKNGKFDLR
jgi:hypothetical protein